MKINNSPQMNRGFTLIEIMVSLALFTVVAVIAVGAFLKIIDANEQSQSLQTAMNNTSFALESMVREMRVGSNYYCFNASNPNPVPGSLSGTTGCAFGQYTDPGIAFISSIKSQDKTCNLIHAYILSPSTSATPNILEKAEQTSCNDTVSANNFIPLTSSDLNIQSFGIKVDGGNGTHTQPKVFMMLKAFAGPTQRERTYFTVQTTASQRSMIGS
jgi:prepilin-type N-terminal cleavage/methylation domain-containing protein